MPDCTADGLTLSGLGRRVVEAHFDENRPLSCLSDFALMDTSFMHGDCASHQVSNKTGVRTTAASLAGGRGFGLSVAQSRGDVHRNPSSKGGGRSSRWTRTRARRIRGGRPLVADTSASGATRGREYLQSWRAKGIRARNHLMLFAALVLPVTALSQDGRSPSYQPGERFVIDMYDDRTGRCTVVPQDGYRFSFQCGGRAPTEEDMRPYVRPPLRVGKSWTHQFHGVIVGEERILEVEVVVRERISVPAGTYDTYRLELEERHADHDNGSHQVCWYASDVQFPVKCEGDISSSFVLADHTE